MPTPPATSSWAGAAAAARWSVPPKGPSTRTVGGGDAVCHCPRRPRSLPTTRSLSRDVHRREPVTLIWCVHVPPPPPPPPPPMAPLPPPPPPLRTAPVSDAVNGWNWSGETAGMLRYTTCPGATAAPPSLAASSMATTSFPRERIETMRTRRDGRHRWESRRTSACRRGGGRRWGVRCGASVGLWDRVFETGRGASSLSAT